LSWPDTKHMPSALHFYLQAMYLTPSIAHRHWLPSSFESSHYLYIYIYIIYIIYTSVKIISKNIRNRNRDRWKKPRNKGEISSIHTHLWTTIEHACTTFKHVTLKIVTHGSLFRLKVSLTCMYDKHHAMFTQQITILLVTNISCLDLYM